eukprot:scaffold13944_cov45-Isochrysis_galbana.AAC.1
MARPPALRPSPGLAGPGGGHCGLVPGPPRRAALHPAGLHLRPAVSGQGPLLQPRHAHAAGAAVAWHDTGGGGLLRAGVAHRL